VLFCVASLAVTVGAFWQQPAASRAGLTLVLLGVPIALWHQHRRAA